MSPNQGGPDVRPIAVAALMGLLAACSTTHPPDVQPITATATSGSAVAGGSGVGAGAAVGGGSGITGSAATTSGSAVAANATASGSPGSPSAASSTGGSSAPADQVVDQTLVKKGYKAVRHEGQIYYCKTTLTADRFPVTRCDTAERIKAIEKETQSELNHMHMPGVCTGFGCR
jgi:hypothetical protein